MMMNYRVFQARDLWELQRLIKDKLKAGWNLQGGVSVCHLGGDDFSYFQAMTKGG